MSGPNEIPISLPLAHCRGCGDIVPYADEDDGTLWARCSLCDEVIHPWKELEQMVALQDLDDIGLSVVDPFAKASCCGTGGGCASKAKARARKKKKKEAAS